jgi:serine/threonine protein kinase/tetratricopeptide (TPR) repeat protein
MLASGGKSSMLNPGTRVGPFEVVSLLGAGGMGEVYRARDPRLEREVALKLLPDETLASPSARARLLREARMAARLSHPNICTVHEVGEDAGQVYIAMELVAGSSLADRLEGGALAPQEVLRYGAQIAGALAHAHARGVVHRDLKSSNVVITPEGQTKVLDFGLAKPLAGGEPLDRSATTEEALTAVGAVAGTPAYMAPEQLRGEAADARSDVWALGVVLHEMASGERPFRGSTGYELSSAILTAPPPPLPSTAPAGLAAVVERCLAKQRSERYQRAEEVGAALEAIRAGDVLPGPPRSRSRPPRRRVKLATRIATAVAGLAVVAVAGWWMLGRGRPLEASSPYPVAVLPPENLTQEEDYFVVGQHQALIDQLASIVGFRVISRPSVLRYRDTDMTLSEIAAELGVQGLVTFSLERHGDTVGIRVQMIEAEPQEHQLWSGSFDDGIADLYSMYGEAARAVAASAGVRVTSAEETRLGGTRPIDPATYESYLKGMHLVYKDTPEDIAQGLIYLHEATDRNPTDAMAWAGLALGYVAVGHGPLPTPEVWTRARAAAERALRLDPNLAEAWSATADVRFFEDWDWEGAEEAFRRANELNPSIAMNHFQYAWLLLVLNRYEEGVVEHELAKKLDPFTPFQSALLGWCYLYGGEIEKAKEEARRTLELHPDEPSGLFVLGAALQTEQRHEEAIAVHERMGELYPFFRWLTGITYARAGRGEDARRIAAEIQDGKMTAMDVFGLAVLYGALGDVDATYRWLTHEPNHCWRAGVAGDPIVGIPREVLANPRFDEFMARLNLPWWKG